MTRVSVFCGQLSYCCAAPAERTAMDGAHKRQRWTSDLVVGDEGEAGAKRQRVQHGVAAAGRKGQATQIRAAAGAGIPAEVRKEVAKAMEAGSALVQASLEHLETAERSWDKWVAENAVVIKKFPTEVQVLSAWVGARLRPCHHPLGVDSIQLPGRTCTQPTGLGQKGLASTCRRWCGVLY